MVEDGEAGFTAVGDPGEALGGGAAQVPHGDRGVSKRECDGVGGGNDGFFEPCAVGGDKRDASEEHELGLPPDVPANHHRGRLKAGQVDVLAEGHHPL